MTSSSITPPSGDPVRVLAGDRLSVTISGTVLDPTQAGIDGNTSLKIYRPARASLLSTRVAPTDLRRGIRVETLFGDDVDVQYEVTSQYKNGVHVDANGRYWMRRPDGWHEMSVRDEPVKLTLGVFQPKDAHRLAEDREK